MANAKPVISFKALQLANEQRNAYGLRYNDFTRYRKHCANRTHRLRSALKMTHGKGREFKKIPPVSTENLKDAHLQLLLLEAERAWAYSQELSSLALQPANKASALRHSATGRFRRSVHWATQLLSHCQALYTTSRMCAENLVQVTIYTLILNGQFLRYRDEFEDGLVQLCVARGLLDELAATASTSRDQALATLYSDEVGPEIRYCAHELGRSKTYDVDGIVAQLATKHRNEVVDRCDALVENLRRELEAGSQGEIKTKLGDLEWEGQPVPVRNPELVDVLLKVQEAETRLSKGESGEKGKGKAKQGRGAGSKTGVAAYDAILLALSDAEEVARKLVEPQQLSDPNTGSSSPGTRDIQFVHAYIVYQLLSRRIQRDLLLVSALITSQWPAKSRGVTGKQGTISQKGHVDGRLFPAVIKLLDTVLQSLHQMRTLSVVDESPDLASAVEARLSFTKAKRCLYLSRCYAPIKKYAEALTLVQHSNIRLRETRSTLSLSESDPITSGNPAYYALTNGDLDALEGDLSTDGLRFKKDWFAYNGGSTDPDNKSYKKPLFFDIALNYAQLDMDRLQARAGKPVEVATPARIQSTVEKKPTTKAKAEEEVRPQTPEPTAQGRGGLGSLLGGWWGRK